MCLARLPLPSQKVTVIFDGTVGELLYRGRPPVNRTGYGATPRERGYFKPGSQGVVS